MKSTSKDFKEQKNRKQYIDSIRTCQWMLAGTFISVITLIIINILQ